MRGTLKDEEKKDQETRPDPTKVDKETEPDYREVQARVEAAVLATETESERKDPLIGTIIGDRFEVVGRIGAGGMGVVYKARQLGMERFVAVKLMIRDLAAQESVVKRFKIEALAASRLTHPNTIRIYDFGQTKDGNLYIAMEYLEGRTLSEVMEKEAPLPVRRVLHIIRQVALSLAEAHSKGIVHRDLKPDNIFLTKVGEDEDFVKVLDFGVAKLREADSRFGTVTHAGVIFGTPRYMAPEQCRSAQNVDHRADIYAIGVITYEALMGVPPFEADNPLALLMKHLQESPRAFKVVRPEIKVPEEVEALVMRCLEKDPQRRFGSASELAEEISRIEARLKGPFERVVFLEAKARKRPGGPVTRRKVLIGLGLLVPLTLLALLVLWPRPKVPNETFEKVEAPPKVTSQGPKKTEAFQEVAKTVKIKFSSEPPGAKVFDGEKVIGTTPIEETFLSSKDPRKFRFVLEGYEPYEVDVPLDKSSEVAISLVRIEARKERVSTGKKPPPGPRPEKTEKEGPSRLGDLKKAPF